MNELRHLTEMRFYVQSRHKNRHPLVLPKERRNGAVGGGNEGKEEEEDGESEKAMHFIIPYKSKKK